MGKKLDKYMKDWNAFGYLHLYTDDQETLGVISLCLGVWLAVVVLHNSQLPLEQQLYFEKVHTVTDEGWVNGGTSRGGGVIHHLENESPFSHTAVDNLCFYLWALSFVTVLGGAGRILTTSFFCVHLCRNRLTGQLFWAWLVLSTLAVTIEVLVSYDLMHTLSHNDVVEPYNRDFFFSNDIHFGFYWLCQTLRYFIWIDLAFSGLAQTAVCSVYRLEVQRQDQF